METSFINDTQKQHAIRPGEIVIEIDNEHVTVESKPVVDDHDPFNHAKMRILKTETRAGNRHIVFPPCDSRTNIGQTTNFVRTRRELIRDGEDARFNMDPALRSIDFIPGERIHIHLQDRIGRITDAIFDPENDEMYQKLIRIGAQLHGPRRMFWPGEYVQIDLSADPHAFYGWLYHMRKIMDGDREHCGGPERHRGCATSGSRLCRPIQNVEQMPTMLEILSSKKVIVPCVQYGKVEKQKEWEERRKLEDPDYVRQDGDEIVLTPWLAGLKESKTAVLD